MFDTLVFHQKYFFFLESNAKLCTRIYGVFLYFSGLGIVQAQHKHESFSKSDYEFRQATGLVLTSLELQLAIITGCAAMRAPHLRPWLLPNNFLTKLDWGERSKHGTRPENFILQKSTKFLTRGQTIINHRIRGTI